MSQSHLDAANGHARAPPLPYAAYGSFFACDWCPFAASPRQALPAAVASDMSPRTGQPFMPPLTWRIQGTFLAFAQPHAARAQQALKQAVQDPAQALQAPSARAGGRARSSAGLGGGGRQVDVHQVLLLGRRQRLHAWQRRRDLPEQRLRASDLRCMRRLRSWCGS